MHAKQRGDNKGLPFGRFVGKMDVSVITSRYDGRGRLMRLLGIASTFPVRDACHSVVGTVVASGACTDFCGVWLQDLRTAALCAAHDLTRCSLDTKTYRSICEQGGEALGPTRVYDASWVAATDAAAADRQKLLERDLTTANSGQNRVLMHV